MCILILAKKWERPRIKLTWHCVINVRRGSRGTNAHVWQWYTG